MPLLGLLWGASGLTSVGRYLMIAAACLTVAGVAANGLVAPYRAQINLLEGRVQAINKDYRDLVKAVKSRDAQIEADRKNAEANDAEAAAMAAHVEKVIHETSGSPAACKLSASQLRDLKQFAKR